jgi:glycosyltransferase involved in cell wall biosynthesis
MTPHILLINWRDTRNPEAGGAEIYYHEIFRRLAARGMRVDVLAHTFAGAPAEETVDGLRVVRRGSRSLFNYDVAPYLRRHAGEYDLIIEDLNKLPFFTPLYVRRPRLHMVMHFFGGAIFHEAAWPLAAYVYLMERLVSVAYRGEHFVTISASTRDDVLRRVGHAASIDVVEPGIDTSYFHPACAKSATPLLVCVGRLKKYKNVQFLIDALPALRERAGDVALEIAGAGDYLGALKRRAQRQGVAGRVRFLGRVSEEQKRELLSRATLFVNSSAKEGWGITTIEAAMCGTVSVASDVPGLRDSVRRGETGELFRYNDREDFVAKTAALLADHERRERMEEAARRFAESLSWDSMAQRMEQVIADRLRDGRPG